MTPRIEARPFFRPETAELRYLPESPRMIGGKLFWVSIQYGPDAKQGGLNALDPVTLVNRHFPLPGRPGFVAPGPRAGMLVMGVERQLVLWDLAGERIVQTLAELPENPRIVINDGLAIDGGVIFGTKDLEFKEPIAAMYYYDYAARRLREVLSRQTCSNGKYLHGSLLVDVDSTPRTITEYRWGYPLERVRRILQPEKLPAIPDGMRPAPGGESVVIAFVNTDAKADGLAQEIRLSDGAVLREWVCLGSPRVTCPELAGIEGSLYWIFTTAAENLSPDQLKQAPHAGTLFYAPAPPPLR